MRVLDLQLVTNNVKQLLLDGCVAIPNNVLCSLKKAYLNETNILSKEVIGKIIDNDELAIAKNLPLCQDTGIVVVFLEIGSQVVFDGDIYQAINEGVRQAYIEGYFRKSVVKHPLDRVNTKDNTPAIVHTKIVAGDKVKISIAPKGGGSENMSVVKMLIPADGIKGIKQLVIDTIVAGGGKPCPPLVVGVGIGGDLEKAALLAKEALFREIDDINPDPIAKQLEEELLDEINATNVGPMGFGGKTTCLAVKVNTYPCHIASLPVAVNLQCHAARHKECII